MMPAPRAKGAKRREKARKGADCPLGDGSLLAGRMLACAPEWRSHLGRHRPGEVVSLRAKNRFAARQMSRDTHTRAHIHAHTHTHTHTHTRARTHAHTHTRTNAPSPAYLTCPEHPHPPIRRAGAILARTKLARRHAHGASGWRAGIALATASAASVCPSRTRASDCAGGCAQEQARARAAPREVCACVCVRARARVHACVHLMRMPPWMCACVHACVCM